MYILCFEYQFLLKFLMKCFSLVQEPNTQEKEEKSFKELSSFDVHNLVKARLKSKGIDLKQANIQPPILQVYYLYIFN